MSDNGASQADLSQILALKPKKAVWINYVDDFDIEVNYLSKEQLNRIVDQSTILGWNKSTHQREEKTDREKLTKLFADHVVNNWRGLTFRILKKIALVEEGVKLDDDQEIGYSQDNARWLIKASFDLDPWLRDQCMDLDNFQNVKREEALVKNS